ncbi:putative late blight resistance protein homolog r1a-6 [Phtheirospermum japonicum]|uniref:Putative late blight resistance protein homolog r1a-6 n=1 Tax=Phtheirospermum japonicum TaxID=374723 RepID=A0A830B5P4_9LAMI|nr:putative late blight resistance protein homolog r1a-6 [Phtheirospermum japonicum]
MAYAALISLKQTIHGFLNSSHVSISPPSREVLDAVYEEAQCIQKLLKHLDYKGVKNGMDDDRKQMNAFETEMRDAACSLEDALEIHFVNLTDHENKPHSSTIHLDMTELKQDIDSFTRIVKQYIHRDDDDDEEDGDDYEEEEAKRDDDDDHDVTSRKHLDENKSKMVGFTDIFHQIKDHLLLTHWSKDSNPRIEKVSLVGMAGIGKTTLAKKVYEDPSISRRFDHRAWVNVGQKYQVKVILQSILSQVSPGTNKMHKLEDVYRMLTQEEEEEEDDDNAVIREDFDNYSSVSNFYECLEDTGRYLIVLDDVWDPHVVDYFEGSLPYDSHYEILILSTTRLDHVGASAEMFKLRLLNNEESWDLLREKMFGAHELCPPHLEKAGKKIAENCEGLALTIVTVADILSKADEMIPEYWNKVAEKESSVFTDAYDRISKVLYPSYEYLPPHLKALFLYMAVFPQNYKIPVTRIGMLWAAEGFLESSYSALTCIEDFVNLNLVLDLQSSYNYRLKVCAVHSVFWHLCVRRARENKLFQVLRNYADSLAQGIRNQRRLCIHNNVLFGIKDAHKSMSSISTARSLLCTGPLHQYPVPICFSLRLLRVIDALTIRFYEFPVEVLKLVQLRYLALICDGKLPKSISKLWNLQFLIVRRYLSMTKLCKDELYLPIEIWDMKELKHLQVTGSNLPDPCDGALLPNLVTLLDVSARSCTKGVLEGLPKLEKLGVRIELSVHVDEPFSCFDHISHFNELESVKCVVVNPELGLKVIAPPASSSLFPECLEKLSLSGCGYSWEDMKTISSFPFLQVLKLRCYAFRGSKWEIKDDDFPRLRSLLIEDTDLVQWIVGSGSFRLLECLILKNCYKLEQIHGDFGESLESVEIIDCNPFAVNYAKQLQKDNSTLKLSIHSSWDVGKFKYKYSQLG